MQPPQARSPNYDLVELTGLEPPAPRARRRNRGRFIDPADVREVIHGFGRMNAAKACGVSLKQVDRWMSGRTAIPLAAYRLLRILGERDLGEIDRSWAGWQIFKEHLHTPEGIPIKQGDYYATPYALAAAEDRQRMLLSHIKRLTRLFAAYRSRRPAAPPPEGPRQYTFLTPVPAPATPWLERRRGIRQYRAPEQLAPTIPPAPSHGQVVSIIERRSLQR